MPRPPSRPTFLILPGGSQNPSHYAYLLHLLQVAGHPTCSALLPSMGGINATAQDDADYIRNSLILPILDIEQHDVILVMHSYSGIPGSAAAAGLGKKARAKEGKNGVLGQIFLASLLVKGGDGSSMVDAFGGKLPPHISIDETRNLITCEDPAPPLYGDLEPQALQDAMVLSTRCPSLASFMGPSPRASWDEEDYAGSLAYIRTLKDAAIPPAVQDMMMQGTGVQWIVKDIAAGHSAQAVEPEKLCDMLIELGKVLEEL
ncbi:hypothetical protein B0O99DRAFT_746179 [Bisporella sp. PMI_857]|nr:hypothetical protein B0O99DRAFT_746179 [Bisporella sp. PMI_857]